MKPAALPLFGDAYLADTRHLSLEEHGAYLMLLLVAWRSEGCRLPNDDNRLARILGVSPGKWRKLKPSIMPFWSLEGDHWVQKRLSKERAFVEEKSAKNRAAADARWSGQTSENKQDAQCERSSERNAPPPPPKKEEESVATATGAEAPSPADLKAAVFASGVPLLTSTGTPERSARAMLGRWRSDYGDGATLDALAACTQHAASNPIPFIRRTLETRNGKSNPGARPGAANDLISALASARVEEAEYQSGYQADDPGAWGALPASIAGNA